MTKLSKSDLPDYQGSFWEWWDNRPTSQHFAEGTFVKIAHEAPAEVLELIEKDGARFLRIRHEDGRVSLIKPIALN